VQRLKCGADLPDGVRSIAPRVDLFTP
jgi:hypothetical protein